MRTVREPSEEANSVHHCQYNYDVFNQSVTIKFYFWCKRKIIVFLGNRKMQLLFCAVIERKYIFLEMKACILAKLEKRRWKLCSKRWWTWHTFCPYFSSFRANRKSMLIILKIYVLVDMMLQTVHETVSYILAKNSVFCSGSHDFKLSWWRHQLTYVYILNILSKFD